MYFKQIMALVTGVVPGGRLGKEERNKYLTKNYNKK
jgi:hypothetical protein